MKKLTLAAALLAVTAGGAYAQTVRMASEGAYPPYNLVNESGDLDGFDIAVGNEICARAELECVWVKNDWDSIIPNLVSGNYDAILAAMSITNERKESIGFSESYIPPAPSSYFAVTEEPDLSGVVAAQTSTVQSAYISESDATLLEFATIDEVAAAVGNGESDAGFGDHEVVRPFVEASPDLMFVGDQVFLDEGIGIGLRKSDTELKEKFDAAIASMKEDGTLNGLITEWFGEEALVFGADGTGVPASEAAAE
ncbi:transporter substrate-binding domain-containing protein [Paracoccus aerodenitrificans]|uniref:transporter substrate-binding domain-containing protein n=1 Tax=Paracoccus aerodenitrificans TaxID=3017781 RepID=UPI0022F0F128|nr:transporter substrate-binding domain-containing protein [Paracoccus aerodenitrificans]WBU64514.1 transporter substrate-binding domain-containing protein [Paracoccus aerodenitrificans]